MRGPASETQQLVASASRAKTTMLSKPDLFVNHHQHFQQQQQQQQQEACQKRRLDSFMDNTSGSDTSGLGPAEAALWTMLERRRRDRQQQRQAAKQMKQQQLNHQSLPEFIATPTGKIWRKTADEFVYRDSRAALLHLIPTDDIEDGKPVKTAASKSSTCPAKTPVSKTAPLPGRPPMRFLVRPRFPSSVC